MSCIKFSALAALVALSASALSGCGGQNEGPANPRTIKAVAPMIAPPRMPVDAPASAPVAASIPDANPAHPKKPIDIDIYGDDSMMGLTGMGFGIPTLTQNTEPNNSQAILHATFPEVTITNHASGGTASSLVNMMAGMDGGGLPFAQRIAGSKAEIVVDNHAINDDLMQSLGPYTDALIQWIQDVRNAGKVPVIEEPNPVCDGNHPHLDGYVMTMQNVAAAYNVPIVHQYYEILSMPDWQSHMWNCFLPDEYLLNIKAQRQAAVLALLVKAALGE